jgi:hypothetical protein
MQVLTECPLTVVIFLQLYKQDVQQHIPGLVPLIIRALHPQVLVQGWCLGRWCSSLLLQLPRAKHLYSRELELLSVAAQLRGRQLLASELRYGAHLYARSDDRWLTWRPQVAKEAVKEHTRQAYTDLIACQVKTLSFVAYILARYQA